MTDDDIHRPRRRRWLVALLALLILAAGGALLLRHYLRPENLTALLVGQARRVLGADLATGGVAYFEFAPRLRLVLPHPVLKAPGAGPAFLSADSLEAVVPWRTLWADRYDIDRIVLTRPVLDLDALHAWLDARPPSDAAPPDVRFTLALDDGSVVSGGKTLAAGVTLQFASSGDVAAWLAGLGAGTDIRSLLPPLAGRADAAVVEIGDTRLEGVHVEVRDDDAAVRPSKDP